MPGGCGLPVRGSHRPQSALRLVGNGVAGSTSWRHFKVALSLFTVTLGWAGSSGGWTS